MTTTRRNLLTAAAAASALGGAPNARAAEPKILRERIEWLEIRVNDATATDLPRALLLGDSISGGYFRGVTEELKGKAYVARLGTSKALGDPALFDEIRMVLGQYRFAVVHCNNGLHGWDYTEDEYRRAFPEMLAVIRKHAPGAKLVWATTTPYRQGPPDFKQFHERNDRVKERNRIAAAIVAKAGIPTNDLYGLMESHPELVADGVHYKPAGVALMVPQVARAILDALK
jgi:lysophospholipase L1-like esterase